MPHPTWTVTKPGLLTVPVTLSKEIQAPTAQAAAEAFDWPTEDDITHRFFEDSTLRFTDSEEPEVTGPLTGTERTARELTQFRVLQADLDGVTYLFAGGQLLSFSEEHEKQTAQDILGWLGNDLGLTTLNLGDMDSAWEAYIARLTAEGTLSTDEALAGDVDDCYPAFFKSPEFLAAAADTLKPHHPSDAMTAAPQEQSEQTHNNLFAQELQQALEAEYGTNDYGPVCRVRAYSGRGMYGALCLSISLDEDLDTDSVISDTLDNWEARAGAEEAQRLRELLRQRRSDSLGHGLVRYFPRFALDSQFRPDPSETR